MTSVEFDVLERIYAIQKFFHKGQKYMKTFYYNIHNCYKLRKGRNLSISENMNPLTTSVFEIDEKRTCRPVFLTSHYGKKSKS